MHGHAGLCVLLCGGLHMGRMRSRAGLSAGGGVRVPWGMVQRFVAPMQPGNDGAAGALPNYKACIARAPVFIGVRCAGVGPWPCGMHAPLPRAIVLQCSSPSASAGHVLLAAAAASTLPGKQPAAPEAEPDEGVVLRVLIHHTHHKVAAAVDHRRHRCGQRRAVVRHGALREQLVCGAAGQGPRVVIMRVLGAGAWLAQQASRYPPPLVDCRGTRLTSGLVGKPYDQVVIHGHDLDREGLQPGVPGLC